MYWIVQDGSLLTFAESLLCPGELPLSSLLFAELDSYTFRLFFLPIKCIRLFKMALYWHLPPNIATMFKDLASMIFISFSHYGWSELITRGAYGYHLRKWTLQPEFKSLTRLFAFHIALIHLGKVSIQLFSLQLWVNSRSDWALNLGMATSLGERKLFIQIC